MPPEEAARYRLDDCLGGSSATVHQRAIRRIYGDKSADIVEGLKRNPGKKKTIDKLEHYFRSLPDCNWSFYCLKEKSVQM